MRGEVDLVRLLDGIESDYSKAREGYQISVGNLSGNSMRYYGWIPSGVLDSLAIG